MLPTSAYGFGNFFTTKVILPILLVSPFPIAALTFTSTFLGELLPSFTVYLPLAVLVIVFPDPEIVALMFSDAYASWPNSTIIWYYDKSGLKAYND